MSDKDNTLDEQAQKERLIKAGRDFVNAFKDLLLTDVTKLINPFAADDIKPKSLEEIAHLYSNLVDSDIQKKEREENLKFAGGKFKFAWAGSAVKMSTELYYQDSEGQWKKESGSSEMPAEALTDEARKTLEQKKELTYPIEHP